jgi:hypothetical protein
MFCSTVPKKTWQSPEISDIIYSIKVIQDGFYYGEYGEQGGLRILGTGSGGILPRIEDA